MSKRKNKVASGKGQPAVGPRQHLMEKDYGVTSSKVGVLNESESSGAYKGEGRSEQTRGQRGSSKRQNQNRGRR